MRILLILAALLLPTVAQAAPAPRTAIISAFAPEMALLQGALSDRSEETIGPAADAPMGNHWCYVATHSTDAILLRDVLLALHRDGFVGHWRIDPDGVTRFGPRAPAPATARATVLSRNAAVGLISIGIDAPLAFLPGNTYTDQGETRTIRKLVVIETPGNLTAELWVATPSVRASVIRMVADVFPQLVFGFPRTYLVHAVDSAGRMDLFPPPDATYLPELARVDQWSAGGVKATPEIGSAVMVQFRDANPTRPVVTGCAPLASSKPTAWAADATGAMTIGEHAGEVDIAGGDVVDATGLGRVVRYGDPIVFSAPGPGTVIPGAVLNHFSKVKA